MRTIDVRLIAAVAATLLLVVGVMWVVPTTPNSQSFKFDSARRTFDDARAIELDTPIQNRIVDGSDVDFYRIDPLKSSFRLDVRVTNGSPDMIPGLRIVDATKSVVLEKTVEYLRQPGASIETSFLAQSNVTYYVEVFSQRNTTGRYTLAITVRRPDSP
jgi:hypothetical protein